jgi:hypothetical protein
MCDLLGASDRDRNRPALFFSKRSSDSTSVHNWKPLFDSSQPNRPDELVLTPASDKQITARFELKTESIDITDAAALIVDSLSKE